MHHWGKQAKQAALGMVCTCVLGGVLDAYAQVPAPARQPQRIVEQAVQTGSSDQRRTRLDETDMLMGQLWGLSNEEMERAKILLAGPRRAFSAPNLSPIEALGIHARSDAERRKYAEMFAKVFQADVDRSLAWNQAFTEAQTRLYGQRPVIDYSQLPKVSAPVGAADLGNVPRSQLIEPAKAKR